MHFGASSIGIIWERMNLNESQLDIDLGQIGAAMYNLASELYPICRSITGNGVRETLRIVQRVIPLKIHEVPTGTQAFDWNVPKEWNIRDAYVKNAIGEKVIDFKRSNLHVLNYSVPIHTKLPLAELKEHLFSIPDRPEWIPYKTCYYKPNWGFCLSEKQRQSLDEGEYEVFIDSSLEEGHLTYGEYRIEGETDEEVLLSCHICHPSLCNDNLSGIALVALLAQHLTGRSLRYSYRFVFVPGTIGSITWLSENEPALSRIKHGLVVACVGDPGPMTYKKSRRGDAEIDQVVQQVLAHSGQPHQIREFSPYGYDERQYCSPGFNLAVGSLTRTPHGEFPEYHTSADNLDLVQPEYLADSFSKYLAVIQTLERNKRYLNKNPKCEPQLGKRGLYKAFGGKMDQPKRELAMLWVLNFSDGDHSLLDISRKSGLEFGVIADAADALVAHHLLEAC